VDCRLFEQVEQEAHVQRYRTTTQWSLFLRLHPLDCNPRVHTAIILLPVSSLASCYPAPHTKFVAEKILRPDAKVLPRTWLYNDIIMRLLPYVLPLPDILELIHPSLPACCLSWDQRNSLLPDESPFQLRVDPTLTADDPLPFLVLWHVWWPSLLIKRWWQGKKWTRVSNTSAFHLVFQLLTRTFDLCR
jgi:hypothetical protein